MSAKTTYAAAPKAAIAIAVATRRRVAVKERSNVRAHARAREIVERSAMLLARRGGARC